MENNWEIKTLRVKVKKYDYDPKDNISGNENYVQKAIEYKNKNNVYELLTHWGLIYMDLMYVDY